MSATADATSLHRTTAQWTHIIDTILAKKPDLISVESTDQEFRNDDRNLVAFRNFKCGFAIDSLAHNVKTDAKLLKALLECYDECGGK